MAIKTISQFDAAIPTPSDKILFEQNGEGKSCSIGEAVNTCSLTYEEIMATNPVPDLTNKVASAKALQDTLVKRIYFSGTTSAYGNLDFGPFLDCTKNIVINVSARVKADGAPIVCLPYQYRTSEPDYIDGAHFTSEDESEGAIKNTEIAGYIYYIPF